MNLGYPLLSEDSELVIDPEKTVPRDDSALAGINEFIKFINEELATRSVNTLILRVDYNYEYESHPELRYSVALSKADVKKLVAACKKNNIIIIPQVNMLGHQSWAGKTGNLLKVYPQFDETPLVKMPENYVWPNADGLYCKSDPAFPGGCDSPRTCTNLMAALSR